ncbi:hypothetical protein TNCV_2442881 [Trichonephila clavipes]|nr:hypothetical protein TNCV_2442881 [Trichonephila clavipes]
MEDRHPGSPSVKDFKTLKSCTPYFGMEVMCVLYTEFLTKGLTVNFGRSLPPARRAGTSGTSQPLHFFVVTETLQAKTVFEVLEKVEIARSKVDAV